MTKIGFIGAGKVTQAMVKGLLSSGDSSVVILLVFSQLASIMCVYCAVHAEAIVLLKPINLLI